MIDFEKLLDWTSDNPMLTVILGCSAIAGVTVASVFAIKGLTGLAGKALEKGTGFTVSKANCTVSLNQQIPLTVPVAVAQQLPQKV